MLFILVKKIDEDCYLFTRKKNIGFCDKVTSVCEEYIGKVFSFKHRKGFRAFSRRYRRYRCRKIKNKRINGRNRKIQKR